MRASAGSSTTCRRRSSSCSRRGSTRRCRSAPSAPAASCSSCAPTTCASPPRKRTSSSTGGSASGSSDSDVELLVARTEGWPAGIYLAALSLADNPDKAGLVRAFDGTSAHVVDFLSTEVLSAYEPELQAFMLSTSVLERLCVPLCDAVLGERVSAAALETLERTNLFLLPLDDQRRWFRFHHLFTQLLRVELERRNPELVPRAAPACLRLAQRVGHHGGGDPPRDGRRRVRRSRRPDRRDVGVLRQRRPHVVGARVAAALPGRGARRRPAAAAGERVDRRAARRGGGMREALARYRALGGEDEGPLPDGFASLESSVSVLRAAFAWGDVAATLEVGARSAELEGRGVAVAAGGHVVARVGPLLQRRARRGRALAQRDRRARAGHRAVGGRQRGDRRPVADGGHARRPRRADAAGARGARHGARARPARRARGRRGAHRLRRGAGGGRAARGGAARSSSAASSCAGCGRSRSTSPTA